MTLFLSLVAGLLLCFTFFLNLIPVSDSLGCCTESWTLELRCVCTASQASLLGHLGHVRTLPCRYYRRPGGS